MGCEQILTFENGEEFEGQNNPMPNQQPNTNLLVRSYKGILSPEAKFRDTLIRSSDELGEKLRNYIPSQISEGDNKYKYNLYDDILTKSAKIDFDKEYIIAFCEFSLSCNVFIILSIMSFFSEIMFFFLQYSK